MQELCAFVRMLVMSKWLCTQHEKNRTNANTNGTNRCAQSLWQFVGHLFGFFLHFSAFNSPLPLLLCVWWSLAFWFSHSTHRKWNTQPRDDMSLGRLHCAHHFQCTQLFVAFVVTQKRLARKYIKAFFSVLCWVCLLSRFTFERTKMKYKCWCERNERQHRERDGGKKCTEQRMAENVDGLWLVGRPHARQNR